MIRLLKFLGSLLPILLLGFLLYLVYGGMKYLGDNANKTEETTISEYNEEESDKGLLGKAMDKAGEIGGNAKDKIVDTGAALSEQGKMAYNKVSEKVNQATEKLDESVSNLRAAEQDEGGYSEEDDIEESKAAKMEAEMKKAMADKKAKHSAKGTTETKTANSKTDSGPAPKKLSAKSSKDSKSSGAVKSDKQSEKLTSKGTATSTKATPSSYNRAMPPPANSYYVVVGSFKNKKNALTEVANFKKKGFAKSDVVKFPGSKNYNVIVQRSSDRQNARNTAKQLEDGGIPAYVREKKN